MNAHQGTHQNRFHGFWGTSEIYNTAKVLCNWNVALVKKEKKHLVDFHHLQKETLGQVIHNLKALIKDV